MSVYSILTKDYERNDIFAVPENKPNSNPIKPNLPDTQMNVSILLQKAYENKRDWTIGQNKPNSKPIQTQSNPISPTPKGVKQKSDTGYQRSDICLLPSVFWLLSRAPMIAIGFDYNGIFECRKQARNKILFSGLVPDVLVKRP